jgi:hypothetical protein
VIAAAQRAIRRDGLGLRAAEQAHSSRLRAVCGYGQRGHPPSGGRNLDV